MSKVKLNEKINWGNNIISSINELNKKGLIEFEKEGNKYFAILKSEEENKKFVEISEIAYLSKTDKSKIKDVKRKNSKEIDYFAYNPFNRPRYNLWGDLI